MDVYLNDEEIQLVRRQLAERRKPGTYVSGKWSVSSFNRLPEAFQVAPLKFPPKVILRDITLRTITQKPGVAIRNEDRPILARALIETGVRSISFAWASHASADSMRREIEFFRGFGVPLEITMEGGGTQRHLEMCRDAGVDLIQLTTPSVPALNYFYGPIGRDIRRAAWAGEEWRDKIYVPTTVTEQVHYVCDLIRNARDMGLRISAGINMIAYADKEYLEAYIPAVAAAGATDLGLYDGSSGMGPEAWRYVVSLARQLAPDIRIAVHTHNSFGMAVASAMAGVQAGADVVEVSVNGMCSASGQADLAEVAAALELLYGVETGIRLDMLTWLRRLAEDISGFRVADNKPVTGDLVWFYSSEGLESEKAVEPLLHRCVEAKIFGNEEGYCLGQYSGNTNMMQKLIDLGIPVSKQQVPTILSRVKDEMTIRRRGLTDSEIRDIARLILARGASSMPSPATVAASAVEGRTDNPLKYL